ncbi:hypothetical protein ACFSYH_00280 [Populibacterium corticicola]|uniref:Uncharacterized protein n=1 Tax=Populibacterium corticicola TaxID=1812826 RepID=A0ABW5XAN8_9MICO
MATDPLLAGFFLYLSLPTLLRRYETSNYWLALLFLVAAIGAGARPMLELGWLAGLYSPIAALLVLGLAWRKARSLLNRDEKILVQFFFKKPPVYGKNII